MTKIHKTVATTAHEEDIVSKCLNDKCRVCLKDGVIAIFGANDIASAVQEFGGIQLSETDKRPQFLCDTCHSLLEGAILFRHTAQKSEQTLSNVSNYLIDQNTLELPLTGNNQEALKLENILCTIKKLSGNIESTHINGPIDLLQDSADSDASVESDSNDIGGNKCEYLEFSIFSTDDESDVPSNKPEDCTIPVVQSTVICDVCHKVIDIDMYTTHMMQHTDKKKTIKKVSHKMECKICFNMISSKHYKQHLTTHDTESKKVDSFRKCHLCDKILTTSYYNRHMRRVHDDTHKLTNSQQDTEEDSKLQYPVHEKKVDTDIYKQHISSHKVPRKKYVCEKCGMTTSHPSAFKTHCLTHGSELKYKCQYCPYRGLHLSLLKIHERTHTGEYNYKCETCSAKFLTKSNLSQHQRVHRLPIDFICKECNRGFYTKKALGKHYSTIHLKDKSNVCETCGKGFSHRDILLNHQLKVHNRERIVTKGRLATYLKPELNQDLG